MDEENPEEIVQSRLSKNQEHQSDQQYADATETEEEEEEETEAWSSGFSLQAKRTASMSTSKDRTNDQGPTDSSWRNTASSHRSTASSSRAYSVELNTNKKAASTRNKAKKDDSGSESDEFVHRPVKPRRNLRLGLKTKKPQDCLDSEDGAQNCRQVIRSDASMSSSSNLDSLHKDSRTKDVKTVSTSKAKKTPAETASEQSAPEDMQTDSDHDGAVTNASTSVSKAASDETEKRSSSFRSDQEAVLPGKSATALQNASQNHSVDLLAERSLESERPETAASLSQSGGENKLQETRAASSTEPKQAESSSHAQYSAAKAALAQTSLLRRTDSDHSSVERPASNNESEPATSPRSFDREDTALEETSLLRQTISDLSCILARDALQKERTAAQLDVILEAQNCLDAQENTRNVGGSSQEADSNLQLQLPFSTSRKEQDTGDIEMKDSSQDKSGSLEVSSTRTEKPVLTSSLASIPSVAQEPNTSAQASSSAQTEVEKASSAQQHVQQPQQAVPPALNPSKAAGKAQKPEVIVIDSDDEKPTKKKVVHQSARRQQLSDSCHERLQRLQAAIERDFGLNQPAQPKGTKRMSRNCVPDSDDEEQGTVYPNSKRRCTGKVTSIKTQASAVVLPLQASRTQRQAVAARTTQSPGNVSKASPSFSPKDRFAPAKSSTSSSSSYRRPASSYTQVLSSDSRSSITQDGQTSTHRRNIGRHALANILCNRDTKKNEASTTRDSSKASVLSNNDGVSDSEEGTSRRSKSTSLSSAGINAGNKKTSKNKDDIFDSEDEVKRRFARTVLSSVGRNSGNKKVVKNRDEILESEDEASGRSAGGSSSLARQKVNTKTPTTREKPNSQSQPMSDGVADSDVEKQGTDFAAAGSTGKRKASHKSVSFADKLSRTTASHESSKHDHGGSSKSACSASGNGSRFGSSCETASEDADAEDSQSLQVQAMELS
jgi:hypothetical protein